MQIQGLIFVQCGVDTDTEACAEDKSTPKTVVKSWTFVNPCWRSIEPLNLLNPVTSPDAIDFPPNTDLELIEVWGHTPSSRRLRVDKHNVGLLSQFLPESSGVELVTDGYPEYCDTLPALVPGENVELIEKLLKSAANIRYRHPEGGNIVHFAVKRKYSDLIAALGKCGVDLDAVRKDGLTPLCLAVRRGDLATLNALLDSGANANRRLESGKTALYLAVEGKFSKAVTALAKKGTDLNLKAEGGWTFLHAAAKSGDAAVVEALLVGGADIDPQLDSSEDLNGLTPLLLAVKQKDWAVAKALIRRGALLKAVCIDKNVLFHTVDHRGEDDVVDSLLEAGLDVTCLKYDLDFRRAPRRLLPRPHLLIVQKFMQCGVKAPFTKIFVPDLLFCAIYEDMFWLVQELLELGADIHQERAYIHSRLKTTPLSVACKYASADVVGLLLDRGANPFGANSQDAYSPPIVNAIVTGKIDVVKLLLNKNVSVRNPKLLRLAAKQNDHKLMILLLENGCYVNSSDVGALFKIVSRLNCQQCLNILIKYGVHLSWGNTIFEETAISNSNDCFPPLLLKFVLGYTFADSNGPGEARVARNNWKNPGSMSAEKKEFARTLAKHVVKLKAAGKSVADDVLPFELNELYPSNNTKGICYADKFQTECEGEVELMKIRAIPETGVTMFDVLTEDTNCMARLLSEEISQNMLGSYMLYTDYIHYADIIACRIRQANWRREFLARGFKAFNRLVFRLPRLPIEVKEYILGLLSNQDIISLEVSLRPK